MRITESRLRRMIRQVILESSKHSFVEKFHRAYDRRIPRLSDNFKIKAFLERLFVKVSKVNGRDVVDMLERMARSNSSNAIHQAIMAGTSGLSEPSNEKEYSLHNFICALQILNDEGRVHARQNESDRNASLAGLLKNKEVVSLMGGEEQIKDMFNVSAQEVNDSYGEDDLIIIGGAMSGQAITKLLCSIEGELYIVEPKGSIVDFYPEKRRGFDPTLDSYDVDQHGMLYDPDTNTRHTHADGSPVKYF